MKVQLNSAPSYFPKALDGIEKGFGLYSVADSVFIDKDKRVEFASSMVQKINSFISKVPGVKVKGDSKVFLERNSENINYLKENTLESFTKDLLVQLNIDTLPNRVFKNIYKAIGDAENNVRLKEVANSLSNDSNYMLTYHQHEKSLGVVQKGSLVVSANVSDVFFQTMIKKIGLEKTFDFVFFHEAAHHMEAFADKEFQNPMNKDINGFLGKIVNAQKLGYKDLVDPETFSPIKHNIAGSLVSLKKEIYADTVSILTLRNRDIAEGVYNKNETLNFINDIKETRSILHQTNNEGVEPSLYQFTHSTAIGMDYLHEKIQSKDSAPMSMQEMDVFAKDVQSVALARTIHTLKISASDDFIPQLNTIACVQFNGETGMPFLETENRAEKFIEQSQKIKEIAGQEWAENLSNKISKAKESSPNLSPSEVFNIGFSHKKIEGYVETPQLPDANQSISNIMATRAKFLSSTKVKQHTIP